MLYGEYEKPWKQAPRLVSCIVDDLTISFKSTTDNWLDFAELEKLKENSSIKQLTAALAEHRGELLPGFYDEWVAREREHLHAVFDQYMARLKAKTKD